MEIPLIPRAVLFGNPDRTSPEISPDGTRLGFIAPDKGVLNVWVSPLSRPAEAVPVTQDRDRGIPAYGFCHDDRTLIYLQDAGGDENWRVYLHDLLTGESRCATPHHTRAQILRHNQWHPTTVLLGLNSEDPRLSDLYRLELTTGELELVWRNPGFASWICDSDLAVRGGMAMAEDGGAVIYLKDPGSPPHEIVPRLRGDPGFGEFTPWSTIGADDLAGTDVVGFTRDGRTMLLLTPAGANATRLVAFDIASGEERVIAEDPHFDIGGVIQHPETLEPQAVILAKDRAEWVWLDETLGAEVEALREVLRRTTGVDGELALGRSHRADRSWLVPVQPSNGPTRYYVHDRDTGETRFLFSHRPELDDYPLAAMEPFVFTARDGLEVHGYLTFPPGLRDSFSAPGARGRDLPAVVLVHGGPRARDTWGYHPEVQWLANRGYVCIQVNFRGSRGYGKDFLTAGAKEWGRAMNHDLVDAVEYCVEAGWVDRFRVGIMGASYGGYAALAGAAFTPDVFRCAIDVCGPSNLLTLLESVPPYWKPMISYLYATVGDPATERDMLWARSPLSQVEKIEIPVLIVHGANDPRVKQAEADQIVAALAAKGLPHDYLLFKDEGHGLARPESRERFYATAEHFLATHLGGRTEPGPSWSTRS